MYAERHESVVIQFRKLQSGANELKNKKDQLILLITGLGKLHITIFSRTIVPELLFPEPFFGTIISESLFPEPFFPEPFFPEPFFPEQ